MRYKVHAGDISAALSLTKDQVLRLENAMHSALDSIEGNGNKDFSFDEISSLVAPHVLTPEEAWYCAFGLSTMLNQLFTTK
jgi:hypothetical protein